MKDFQKIFILFDRMILIFLEKGTDLKSLETVVSTILPYLKSTSILPLVARTLYRSSAHRSKWIHTWTQVIGLIKQRTMWTHRPLRPLRHHAKSIRWKIQQWKHNRWY